MPNLLNIVHVLPTRAKEYGGPVAVAESMFDEAIRSGYKSNLYPSLEPQNFLKNIFNLYSIIKRANLVHIHGLWSFNCTIAAIVCKITGIPYFITPHGMLDRWALKQSKCKKWIYGQIIEKRNLRNAAAVHFLNDDEKNEASLYGVKFSKCIVLPNGINPEKYVKLPKREELFRKYPALRGKINILYLGRLHPKKGCDLIIPALAEALLYKQDIHLLIAGPDQDGFRSSLEEQIAKHNLNLNVTFFGMVNGLKKLEIFAASDFFLLPSHQEGDSIAVKEAMACGLPVVITRACHFEEIVSLKCGLIVEPNVSQISKAIILLSQNEKYRKDLGENAKKLIHRKYTWKNIAKELHGAYLDMGNIK